MLTIEKVPSEAASAQKRGLEARYYSSIIGKAFETQNLNMKKVKTKEGNMSKIP